MLRTNYRCVRSLNISVDVAKCVENVDTLIHYTHFWTVTKKTCLHWTIYSWQCFNSLVCHLMLKTNYRCVQSLNISVDVAKCVENVHKFTQWFTHFCPLQKTTCPDWTIYSWQGFNSIGWPFMLKNKLQMVSVTQHQCRRRQMCRKCSQIHQVHSLFVRTCPDWTIYSWRTFNSLGCPLTLRTNYRCVQSLNICVDVAKCVENVQTLIHYTHFWTVTKKDLSSLNNLFMAKFQLIRMSSYAKNKLQMCSVTQHHCSDVYTDVEWLNTSVVFLA